MDTLLTTNGKAHTVSFLYKLPVHRFSTHALINHSRAYRYVHHRHMDFKTRTTMATLKTPLLYSHAHWHNVWTIEAEHVVGMLQSMLYMILVKHYQHVNTVRAADNN